MSKIIDADEFYRILENKATMDEVCLLSHTFSLKELAYILYTLPEIEAERPKGEWIPVSERLPEEKDSLFKNEFFDKTSDTVIVTVADRKGQKTTTYAHTIDGKWSCDLLKACSDYKIIAWQPLPEPYKGGEK